MPPTRTHRSTGSQPNIIAAMVPVTGPAPQMELNWCEKVVKQEAGEKFLSSSMRRAGVSACASMPHVRASQRP